MLDLLREEDGVASASGRAPHRPDRKRPMVSTVGIRKAAHLVAVTATQAWAIQSSVKAKVLALEQKALIGQMPPKLLT